MPALAGAGAVTPEGLAAAPKSNCGTPGLSRCMGGRALYWAGAPWQNPVLGMWWQRLRVQFQAELEVSQAALRQTNQPFGEQPIRGHIEWRRRHVPEASLFMK